MHSAEQSSAGSNNGYFLEVHWACLQRQDNCSAAACSSVLQSEWFLEVTYSLVLLDSHLEDINNQEYIIL